MATLRSKATGSKAVQVVLQDGSRRAIGIGKVNQKDASSYVFHIGQVEAAAFSGCALSPATAQWLADTKPQVRRRLAELGLIEPPAEIEGEPVTIGRLVERYLTEQEVKDRTVVRYRNQTAFMRQFFGENGKVDGLSVEDGKRFHKWLRRQKKPNGDPYSDNYIHKIVKTSRQVFDFGLASKLLSENPLKGVKAPESINDERDAEITPEMTKAILNAANPKYRLIIALARYAGLRCPSELAGLKWSHFLWDQNRFIVHSPKTEHCGREKRVVPIFAELLPYVLDGRELAADGVDDVFPDIDADSNLRTETQRILTRAGITDEVPRFFQNCRSSRQTELEAEFPLHVVCKWLGNSESTAKRHYLKLRESHFEQAASAGVLPSVSKAAEMGKIGGNPATTKHEKTLQNACFAGFTEAQEYTWVDAFRTSLSSNSRQIADLLKRFAELDLAA